MPGSGKSIIDEVARDMNIPILIMGDIIREEAQKRGISPTPENLGRIMMEIRKEMGAGIVAKKCLEKINEIRSEVLMIEGVRSLEEVEEFKKVGKLIILAVHASPQTRFQRLIRRGRSDDPKSWEEFLERDFRELSIGIGNVIALADKIVINEGTIKELKNRTRKILEGIMSYVNKSCS